MQNAHTIGGLTATRDRLHRELKAARKYEKTLICAIDHVEGSLRLFEPGGMPSRIMKNVSQHRAKKGEVVRLALKMLREADRPLTALDIVQEQVRIRKLKADDATLVMMRKRVGACLTKLKNDGAVRVIPMAGLYQGWELVR